MASLDVGTKFTTNIPARLDRLPWTSFHTLVVFALGITWILDGLEVTIVGSLSKAMAAPHSLNLTDGQMADSGSAYILGAVLGALVFGRLTDHFGRKKLFLLTVAIYFIGTILTGFSWNYWSLLAFRFITGAGIGGEYGAVNSAIQELIPARRRGVTDLAINGSFWIGAAIGALASIAVQDPDLIPPVLGWRLAFIVGGLLACSVMFIRRFIPESPRWLMTHGRPWEAETIVKSIEKRVIAEHGPLPDEDLPRIAMRTGGEIGWLRVGEVLLVQYTSRTILGVTLMATQAFCYNAIFFTYGMVLSTFYGIAAQNIGWFMLPFALGNFMGPLLLGPLFDSVGRKRMITLTYGLAGILMTITGYLFAIGMLSAVEQTIAWTVIFFFASAGASAAYLTVGESFPLEIRAIAISLFYAFGTFIGGVFAPAIFGRLIETQSRANVFDGYLLGGVLMIIAAIVEMFLGFSAERRSLEDIAPPLSSIADA